MGCADFNANAFLAEGQAETVESNAALLLEDGTIVIFSDEYVRNNAIWAIYQVYGLQEKKQILAKYGRLQEPSPLKEVVKAGYK